MTMKKITLVALALAICTIGYSQFKIETGATVTIEGSATLVLQDVDLLNEGTLDSQVGSKVVMSGTAANTITSNGDDIYDLQIDKDGANVDLLDDLTITNNVEFSNSGNKISIGANDLIMATAATFTGADASHYVQTGSTGELVKNSMGTFTFPVGYDGSTYNPITLNEAGTTDDIGVRVLENALEDGATGTVLADDVVDASWVITETVVGGSNLTVTAQWAASDELGVFDNQACAVTRYDGSTWDILPADEGAATGSDPYTRSKSAYTDVGVFTVAGSSIAAKVVLGINLFLEGPYDGAGMMMDNLRTTSLPGVTTEPYSGLGYAHVGGGGGESFDPTILNVTGNNAIVDWVFVELRTTAANSSKVATQSALLQADGDIVSTDGVSDITFPGVAAGDYYVSVRHRNHCGVMSATDLSLSSVASVVDLTNSASATGGALALVDLGGGVWGLVSGDYDGSGQVQSTDLNSIYPDLGLAGYLPADINLNNQVQTTDFQLLLIPNLGRGAQYNY